jgi:hypothetical protein
MPSNFDIIKGGQAGNKKDNGAACLYFLSCLAFLQPAADRAVSKLPWVKLHKQKSKAKKR